MKPHLPDPSCPLSHSPPAQATVKIALGALQSFPPPLGDGDVSSIKLEKETRICRIEGMSRLGSEGGAAYVMFTGGGENRGRLGRRGDNTWCPLCR
eukprot:1391977-Amorphochlora_amoeboformis.AAC.1